MYLSVDGEFAFYCSEDIKVNLRTGESQKVIFTWFILLCKQVINQSKYQTNPIYISKQNKTRNIRTLRHWRATSFGLKKQKALYVLKVCLYLSYPACNALAPYCHLWPVGLYNIFAHYVITVWFSKRGCWPQNVCFDFLYKFCLKHFSFRV